MAKPHRPTPKRQSNHQQPNPTNPRHRIRQHIKPRRRKHLGTTRNNHKRTEKLLHHHPHIPKQTMNFNNKLNTALTLLETTIEQGKEYPIEAAIDHYMDTYNNDMTEAYAAIIIDLRKHYIPQIMQTITTIEQHDRMSTHRQRLSSLFIQLNPSRYTNLNHTQANNQFVKSLISINNTAQELTPEINKLTSNQARLQWTHPRNETHQPEQFTSREALKPLTDLQQLLNELKENMETVYSYFKQGL